MRYPGNPFDELYVSETIRPAEFVTLFSPRLVPHAQALFEPTNVVVQGVQGSGKTMLLNLLKPSVRIAYDNADAPFPVEGAQGRFVGCGINLRKSSALDFGQRLTRGDPGRVGRLFGDYINFELFANLLAGLTMLGSAAGLRTAATLGISVDEGSLDVFAAAISRSDVWLGALGNVQRFRQLEAKVQRRLAVYREFLLFNREALPTHLEETKTPIGISLAGTVRVLRETGVIPAALPVFFRVDQYEELASLEELRQDECGLLFAQVVNRALAYRDRDLLFRVGTRKHAWHDRQLAIYGTTSILEEERDYLRIDLDEIVEKKENAPWIFPGFARDVFARRLRAAGVQADEDSGLRDVMGEGESEEDEARGYAGEVQASRALRLPVGFSSEWQRFLETLYDESPLDATLARAWALQHGGQRLLNPPPADEPWRTIGWWRKERTEQALLQLASRCLQRLRWGGESDILSLSGGNILVFVSICRHVWGAWQRADPEVSAVASEIPLEAQAVGISNASDYWFEKMAEWPGGAGRKRFVSELGTRFRERLLADGAMRYPGHNGFSVVEEEFAAEEDVRRFLAEAVFYGDLVSRTHSTRARGDRRRRRKFYLRPVLSPSFQLPVGHRKEPWYVDIERVEKLVRWARGEDGGGGGNLPPELGERIADGGDEQLSFLQG